MAKEPYKYDSRTYQDLFSYKPDEHLYVNGDGKIFVNVDITRLIELGMYKDEDIEEIAKNEEYRLAVYRLEQANQELTVAQIAVIDANEAILKIAKRLLSNSHLELKSPNPNKDLP